MKQYWRFQHHHNTEQANNLDIHNIYTLTKAIQEFPGKIIINISAPLTVDKDRAKA